MQKYTTQETNPNLEKFYKGFHSFDSMNLQNDFIVFKTGDVRGSVKDAQTRIAELNLPLEVLPSKFPFNTYIVKEVYHV